jgi:glycosyltransferase involved in cell wall biosynthesis
MDLRAYDLVISSESGPAKGVLTAAGTRHICYCHSPMRYLWDLYPTYLHDWTRSLWKKTAMAAFGSALRVWDYSAAARVDEFAANSRNVQKRIWRAYRRESQVIYPPVAVETFRWMSPEDTYLMVSELVAYKRAGDAVRCFTRTGRRLKIVGDGPEYASLKKQAGPNVEFCGRVSSGDRCRLQRDFLRVLR